MPYGVNTVPSAPAANLGAGGGAGSGAIGGFNTNGGPGGSGVVILRYPAVLSITSVGLTLSTSTLGTNKVTRITAGTGTLYFT